jgi:hypothetical protein
MPSTATAMATSNQYQLVNLSDTARSAVRVWADEKPKSVGEMNSVVCTSAPTSSATMTTKPPANSAPPRRIGTHNMANTGSSANATAMTTPPAMNSAGPENAFVLGMTLT